MSSDAVLNSASKPLRGQKALVTGASSGIGRARWRRQYRQARGCSTHGGMACFDESDYVVGTTLFVDGSITLYPGFATGG